MDELLAERLRAAEAGGGLRLDLGGLGLRTLPAAVFDFADTLELLNLSQNELVDLPAELARLRRMKILFASQNGFEHVPGVVGECAELSMVGFKANRIVRVSGEALPQKLRWLILTDNRIANLPEELGSRVALQKLMLSGNRLRDLPETMAGCVNLELVRLASNELEELPFWLLELPKLAWLALAGNGCAPLREVERMTEVDWAELEVEERLGEGASGWVHRARWNGREVAVKIFKGAVTSDGLPEFEMAASMAAGRHEHLIETLAKLRGHPQGSEGLVMGILEEKFGNLAGPPSFESCTRDVYGHGVKFARHQVLALAKAMASAAWHLHERGILHGDFYAHNMVWDGGVECRLGDFGGASFYERGSASGVLLERLEVRAFGCFLQELLERCAEKGERLERLCECCLDGVVRQRPSFAELVGELAEIGG